MPERAWKWTGRVVAGSLDFGAELWKPDLSRFESADAIRAARSAAGHPPDEGSVMFTVTASLLHDVIDAAGGIENAVIRLHETDDRVQAAYGQPGTKSGDDDLPDGCGISDPNVEDAWYTMEELLTWARTLDDRLRRRAHSRPFPDQGLIPALADGPRRNQIVAARDRLLKSGLQEARHLAGLNLHMQSSQAGSKRGLVRSGRIVLPFPDPVKSPVLHRWQLTYYTNRDAVSFADALMTSVERFMDEMLTAFERHFPEFRKRSQ